MNTQPFTKPPLTIEEQLRLLRSRGLIIINEESAQHYLKFISYYRFCGYGIEFEEKLDSNDKRYQASTTFEKILDCYIFDRKLRLLVIDAIERIEVAIRSVMINELSLKYGAHWYLQKKLFLPKFKHDELIQTIEKETSYKAKDGSIQHQKREQFIQHYFRKYSHPPLPAVWMIAEVLPLGTWSSIFANLINREDQKLICNNFKINYVLMTSWLHALTYLRNLCAHHSKLWSRHFTLKPIIAKNYQTQFEHNTKFAAQAAIIKIFLQTVSPSSDWSHHLYNLICDHPTIDVRKMGFRTNWQDDPFWEIKKEALTVHSLKNNDIPLPHVTKAIIA
jgi:abortive infection bacteriophage resistance protein